MSKKIEKSVCPVCGKKFVKRAVNQKYCCIKCKRAAARAEKVELKKGDQFKANGKKFVCVKGGKKPVAKVVKGKAVENIRLPKPPTVKGVKPEVIQIVCQHTIHPSDIISWQGFTPKRLLNYALRLATFSAAELDKKAAKKPVKKGKK